MSLHVFNSAKSAMEFIPFENISRGLSRTCRAGFAPGMESAGGTGGKKEEQEETHA